MGFPKVVFKVIENNKCPLYEYGDSFELTGIAIPLTKESENSFITTSIVKYPSQKEPCKILTGDLGRILIKYERGDKIPFCMISCSSCKGSLKIEYSKDEGIFSHSDTYSNELGSMIHVLSEFAFFRNIDSKHLDTVINFFKLNTYDTGEVVIRKGDPGGKFYIIVSGNVNVLNDAGIIIATLDTGDVFGEMSLICNEDVNATIQVKNPAKILSINQFNFNKILDYYPSIQLYFSRLIAGRLNKSNQIRAEDLASGMIGNLAEIPPEALFQTLNMNSKTGVLTITELPKGTARFSFRQGSLIRARYDEYTGDLAFYQILKESTGRFRFTPGISSAEFNTPEIGFFMKLLMEGMRRLDEGKNRRVN